MNYVLTKYNYDRGELIRVSVANNPGFEILLPVDICDVTAECQRLADHVCQSEKVDSCYVYLCRRENEVACAMAGSTFPLQRGKSNTGKGVQGTVYVRSPYQIDAVRVTIPLEVSSVLASN